MEIDSRVLIRTSDTGRRGARVPAISRGSLHALEVLHVERLGTRGPGDSYSGRCGRGWGTCAAPPDPGQSHGQDQRQKDHCQTDRGDGRDKPWLEGDAKPAGTHDAYLNSIEVTSLAHALPVNPGITAFKVPSFPMAIIESALPLMSAMATSAM